MGGMTNAFQSAQIAQMASNDYQNALRIQQQIQAQQQQSGYKAPGSTGEAAADSYTPSQQTASLGLYNPQTTGQTVGLGYGMVPGMKLDGSSSISYDMPAVPNVPLENMPSVPSVPLDGMPAVPSVPLSNMPSIDMSSYLSSLPSSSSSSGTQNSALIQQAMALESQKTALLNQMTALANSGSSDSQTQITALMTQYQAINQQEMSLSSQSYYSQNYAGTSSIDMSSYLSSASSSAGTVDTSAYNNVSNLMDLSSLTAAVQAANSGSSSSSSSSSGTQNSALIQQAMALEAQKTALIQQMSSTTDQDQLTALMTQYQAINAQENALSSQLMSSSTGTAALSSTAATSAAASTAAATASSSSSTSTTKAVEAEPEEAKGEDTAESDYIDPFEPLKEDLAAGAQEITDRHEAVDTQRQTSKEEYAAGDHGLGREVVNQAWYNLKENVGNTATVVKTVAKAAVDTVIVAPVLALANVGKAVVQAAGETIKPTVQHIQQGIQEVKDRHVAVEADRNKSKTDYAAGNHGLAKEVVNQAWNNVKENVGNAVTAVKTTAKVAVDTVTAPVRFLANSIKHIFGGK
ncbi:MAG: hypothetical protein V2A78_02340 [bacterium]